MSTGKKKIKIELEDAEGGKYNLSLEGNLSTVKIQKVLQLVEREISNKPFKYTITDEGRRRLSKHSSLNIHYQSEHPNSESSTDRLIENQ